MATDYDLSRPPDVELVLSGEDLEDVFDPKLEDILSAVRSLDPANGRGFVCLAENLEVGDYVQVAGGPDPETGQLRFCVERRVYMRDRTGSVRSHEHFEHLIAGYDEAGFGETKIKTFRHVVHAQTNEVILLEDVISIFEHFKRDRSIFCGINWRSNRDEVDSIVKNRIN